MRDLTQHESPTRRRPVDPGRPRVRLGFPVLLAAILALGVSGSGCGGGDGVATPTQVVMAESITGLWLGTSRIETARGGGCLGPGFRARKGEVERVEVGINQSGGDLAGSIRFLDAPNTCALGGFVESGRVRLDLSDCDVEIQQEVPCISPQIRRDMVLVEADFEGQIRDGTISGTLTFHYATYRAGTLTDNARRTAPRGASVPEESLELIVETALELTPSSNP